MDERIKTADLEKPVLLCILLYTTAHLIEEGLLGFPEWARVYWGIPGYSMPMWLVHNYFFLGFLLGAFVLYRWKPEKRELWALGILYWGALNFLNHLVFSLIFRFYSPGLVTSAFFMGFLVWALTGLGRRRFRRPCVILAGLGIGGLLWLLPIASFMTMEIARMRFMAG